MQYETKKNVLSLRDEFPCPYFSDGRTAALEVLFPDEESARNFHGFLAEGYRRAGRVFYRNVCSACSACVPLRIETERFSLSRSQERTARKNRDIRVESHSAVITPQKFELYRKYVNSKHGEREKDHDYETNLLALHYGYAGTIEMNYYLDGALIGVGIVDEGEDSLSSNYFYYDTCFLARRPGVFSILQELSLAVAMDKKYYYLGFYIQDNPKMSYKGFFRPNQIYENGEWKDFLG